MKNRIWVSLFMACLPWLAMAQSNDDLYFVPKKEKKTTVKKSSVTQKPLAGSTVSSAQAPVVVVKDADGKVRDIDEYNRRYTSRDNTFTSHNDTLYVEEKPYGERGEWVNGFDGSQDDYEYAMRIIRFRNPRYAIPVSSPLYWDVVNGAIASWNWNVYDDGMYAYIFPTYSNPAWWDWRWTWSMAGPGWGWRSPWYYNNWYWGSPYWYGGWYAGYWGGYWDGWYGGYWGPGWHHHPYYGGSGWYRSGHTDYRPSRYQNYTSSVRRSNVMAGDGSFTRRTNLPGRNGTSSIGRVVRPGEVNFGNSVRNPGGSSLRGGGSSLQTRFERPSQGGSSSYTRPGSSYTRPSTTIDRNGSFYSRPSNTRRSSEFNNSSRPSRSGFGSSTRSSFSSGGSAPRSSFGGSVRSGGGGGSSLRRR